MTDTEGKQKKQAHPLYWNTLAFSLLYDIEILNQIVGKLQFNIQEVNIRCLATNRDSSSIKLSLR